MSISTIYHVSVTLPGWAYSEIQHQNKEHEFDMDVMQACVNTEASGSNTYCDCELWAETPVRSQAEVCEKALASVVGKWIDWAEAKELRP